MTERRWLGNDNADAESADDSEQETGSNDPNNNGAGRRKSRFLKRLTITSYLRNNAFLFGGLADKERAQEGHEE